jgi:hypothetical protein
LRRPRRKGRAARRAPGHAGSALAPRPLRGRRTPKLGGERWQSAGATSRHRRSNPCEPMTPSSSCFAAMSAALRFWSAGPPPGGSIAWSTCRALKYRRGEGEILIINNDGHGWWDPKSAAKGDVFDLVQHLDASSNFGQVRKELRRLVGVAPTFPEALRQFPLDAPDRPVAERWKRQPRLRPGSPTWSYLSEQPRIPALILTAAAAADIVRDGPFGSAWFAHHGLDGVVSHVEIRGPDYKGSLKGGTKTLFRFGRALNGSVGSPSPRCRSTL